MDARDALRRYLEQRRDLGESELVLDSLSVEEAMRLLGAARAGSPVAARPDRDASPVSNAPPRATPAPADVTDWREAVRAAGGGPAAKSPVVPTPKVERVEEPVPKRPAEPAPDSAVHVPSTQAGASIASPLEDVPTGLVVGGASRALYEDPAFKLATLQEIAETVAGCRHCPLYATATNPVPGTGNPDADFMIVGEAPGANEDAQGVPFVGQAGQLLTKIIEAIHLSRDDVFIANVLKHRPPGNRNPLPEEVTACSPYLVRQIELVRPKVILALGTFAAQTLLETKLTIGKLRGQIHRYYGVPLIVTYHPAALLRNPAWKRPTWEDVQLARRILDRALAAGA
ncbi:MAG TPA: uracil-DNA glycosylase [Gemmatimonadaceae bacterium]|nr:uracil-DNA glycosylase [Gemmatimonadaceae bacterium]